MGHSPIVLLVEDDMEAAAGLIGAVADVGATVWHAENGADARAILRDARPDLIILDLTLPDVDGLVLCASLKNDALDVPFMVCSTGTTAEKVLSFKLGAEDFVAKPYDIVEVQARVEAILQRRSRQAKSRPIAITYTPSATRADANGGGGGASSVTDLGRLRVDLARWRVTVDDKPLNLTPTEFQLLVFMAHRPGEIISRQELARGVWGNESMSQSRTIDAYMRRIASKLSTAPDATPDDWPPRILNIRGLGYQLSVPRVSAA